MGVQLLTAMEREDSPPDQPQPLVLQPDNIYPRVRRLLSAELTAIEIKRLSCSSSGVDFSRWQDPEQPGFKERTLQNFKQWYEAAVSSEQKLHQLRLEHSEILRVYWQNRHKLAALEGAISIDGASSRVHIDMNKLVQSPVGLGLLTQHELLASHEQPQELQRREPPERQKQERPPAPAWYVSPKFTIPVTAVLASTCTYLLLQSGKK